MMLMVILAVSALMMFALAGRPSGRLLIVGGGCATAYVAAQVYEDGLLERFTDLFTQAGVLAGF